MLSRFLVAVLTFTVKNDKTSWSLWHHTCLLNSVLQLYYLYVPYTGFLHGANNSFYFYSCNGFKINWSNSNFFKFPDVAQRFKIFPFSWNNMLDRFPSSFKYWTRILLGQKEVKVPSSRYLVRASLQTLSVLFVAPFLIWLQSLKRCFVQVQIHTLTMKRETWV